MENMTTDQLETLLVERIDVVKQERTSLKEALESYDNKIKNQMALNSQVPRETEQELTAAMQKLERSHATTSQSTAQERQFMRDMQTIKQKKKALAAYQKIQNEVDVLRSRRTAVLSDLRDRETAINDLQSGLRKVKLAQKLNCNLTDLFEQTINIEENKMSRVVGKGGLNLRNIESDCGVGLQMDHTGGGIHIMGTRATIEAALVVIMGIVETAIEEFTTPEVIIICLFQEKSKLINEISARHNVRMDVSRAKCHVKVTGLVEAVTAAKAEILAIQGLRQTLILEAAYLPFIIGKAGSTITGIEEDFKVSINLNRDNNELEVLGLRSNVLAAMAHIKLMIDTNKEVEEVVRVEKHVLLGCLIGSGGSIIKGINRDFGVRVESEGAKDDQFQSIRVKGTAAKVAQAKAHIMQLIQTFVANTLIFEVPDEFMAVLLGKGGSSIRTLREKYSEANIDIDKNVIHVQSSSPALRAAVKADIDAVIEINYSESIDMSEDCIIQLKSQRGYDLREELLGKDFGLKLIMDKSNNFVKLRGQRQNVIRGMAKLQAFKDNFTTVKISIHDEDYPIFFKNGSTYNSVTKTTSEDNSLVHAFQTKYDIEILAIRKELAFVIRGSPEGVAGAKAAVEGFLAGDPLYGAVLVHLDTLVYSALIGKNGSNIKKMEDEYGVRFDILKTRNLLRVRGDTEKILAARTAVLTFIDNTRVTDTVSIPPVSVLPKKQLDSILKTASEIYQLEVIVSAEDATKLTVKGIYLLTEEAKVYLRDHFQGTCSASIGLLPKHVMIGDKVADNFKRLHDKYRVVFTLNTDSNSLVITGPTAAVYSAKCDAMKFLETFFPTEVHCFEAPSAPALRDMMSYGLFDEVRAVNASIAVHRAINRFFVLSESPSGLIAAKVILANKLAQWSDLNCEVPFEEFMYPMIIGKSGSAISALCKETKVAIEINRATLHLEIKGPSKEIVAEAKETITRRIERLRAEHWEYVIDSDLIGFIIGKAGATINKIRAESGANVDFDPKTYILRVTGAEDKVQAAKAMILEIVEAEEKNKGVTKYVSITTAAIPAIIGTKGSTSKEIQNVSGARLDVDRVNLRCVLKGSEEACTKAASMIEAIMEEQGFNKPVVVTAPVAAPTVLPTISAHSVMDTAAGVAVHGNDASVGVSRSGVKTVPGASLEQLTKQQLAGLSKSALKRYRKKQADALLAQEEQQQQQQQSVATAAHESTASKAPSVSVPVPVASVPLPVPAPAANEQVVPAVEQESSSSSPPPLEVVEDLTVRPVSITPPPFTPAVVVVPPPTPVVTVAPAAARVAVPIAPAVVPAPAVAPQQKAVPESPIKMGAAVPISMPFSLGGGAIRVSSAPTAVSMPPGIGVIGRSNSGNHSTATTTPLTQPPPLNAIGAFSSSFDQLALSSPPAHAVPAPVVLANGSILGAAKPVSSDLFGLLLGGGGGGNNSSSNLLGGLPPALNSGGYAQQQQQQPALGQSYMNQQQQVRPAYQQQPQQQQPMQQQGPPVHAWGAPFMQQQQPSFQQMQEQHHQQQLQFNAMIASSNGVNVNAQHFPPLGGQPQQQQQQQVQAQYGYAAPPGIQQPQYNQQRPPPQQTALPPGLMYQHQQGPPSQQQPVHQPALGSNYASASLGLGTSQYNSELVSSLYTPVNPSNGNNGVVAAAGSTSGDQKSAGYSVRL